VDLGATALVSSAACGADLLALDTAQDRAMRVRIILPFSETRFRTSSVIDRPRPDFWGTMFDRVMATARASGDVIELDCADEGDAAYLTANEAIIAEAKTLADRAGVCPVCMIAWDGTPRDPNDITKKFADRARESGFQLREVRTLGP